MDGSIDGWHKGCMNECMHGWHGWMDDTMDGWMYGWMDSSD